MTLSLSGRSQRTLFPALLFLLLLGFSTGPAFAQNTNPVDSELRDLQAELKEDQSRLLETERAAEQSRRSVDALSNQIASTQTRVSSFRNRLGALADERDSLFTTIDQLEGRIESLKSEYRTRATYAYKHGRLHDIALILSAKSINQMLIRIQYLNRFSSQRKAQLIEIRDASTILKAKREALQRTLITNEVILRDAEKESVDLAQLRKSQQSEVRRLEAQKQLISTNISEKQSEMDNIVAMVTANSDPAQASLAINIQRTNRFESSRGALPWPVYGNVIEPFGEFVNQELGTSTDNVGIVIEAAASSEVSSVFEGSVKLVEVMPGIGRVVFVEHGEYMTVYGNFSLLYVGKGDPVSAGQVLGRSGTDAEPRGRSAFFGVFHNGEPINPSGWLSN